MDGTPPALPTDSEDVVWALQTAESLWKRGERVDAVVWVRRAAQAAGEGDDAKRAATLARFAADLGDWIGSHAIGADAPKGHAEKGAPESASSMNALDALLDVSPLSREASDVFVLSARDVEVVSAKDFEAGFAARSEPARGSPSDSEVMTVSLHAPDVEILEEGEISEREPFPEEEPTPVRHVKSPAPPAEAPTAAQAHAGMLDPWSENDLAPKKAPPKRSGSSSGFDEQEVVTSAKERTAVQPPAAPVSASFPAAPRAPTFAVPRARPSLSRPVVPPEPSKGEEVETTTYRQISPRAGRGGESSPAREPPPPIDAKSKPPAPSFEGRSKAPAPPPIEARSKAPAPPLRDAKPPPLEARPRPPVPAFEPRPKPPTPRPAPPSSPPALDLLEMVDAVVSSDDPPKPSIIPHPSAAPTPTPPKASQVPQSARPTAPPPSSMPIAAMPSGLPTRPRLGATLLDLDAVEALGDLPDDAREAFGQAATIHGITIEEEVSHFALALVVEGDIDVSATIVDAPALRLSKNAVLRSRGSLVPGVALRLVCNSPKATVATWDDAAVAKAFRTCPWVEDDLRAVADRVQAKAGVTMGPLGERFDMSLREHLTSKLTMRNLAPGEVLVDEGKPVGILIVGIGDVTLTKKTGERTGTARPGDFVFPAQTMSHGKAPETATAGAGGAVVLVGDRATAQDLLMTFPPLLEVLAML